jgi:hypothetical protein
MVFHFKKLKYPFYLFLVILVAKFGYIVIESYYNYHVLMITTDSSLTRESVEELNRNGHRISAIGITLLLIPFLYFIVKTIPRRKMLISLFILSLMTYLLSYQSLNYIVEKIVEINKDKRHDAYYVNVLKYGLLNNIFTYNSFVANTKIVENTIDVDDRIMLTNSFLLLEADSTLINKLKKRGELAVAELYIQEELQEDYNKKFRQFKKISIEISKQWNTFNTKRKKLNDKLNLLEDEAFIEKSYTELTNSLSDSYMKYNNVWKKVGKKIREETSMWKVSEMKKKLDKYFSWQSHPKVKAKYKEEMQVYFGHDIDPKRWKDKNKHVTKEQIILVIKNEIIKKAKPEMGDLPRGVSIKEFMYHDSIKRQVSTLLRKKDILIPYDFDYSYKEFHRYFEIMASKKLNSSHKLFYTKLEKKIGKNDLRLNMGWKEYIYSDFIQGKIIKKLNPEKKEDIEKISLVFLSRNLVNFKNLIYLPPISDKVTSKMYTNVQFKIDGTRAALDGDEAIKLLYIPPFALAVSMIALLLNILTVLGMFLALLSHLSIWNVRVVKAMFVLLVFATPMIFINENFINQGPLAKVDKTSFGTYISFLQWISFYEKVNYSFHEKC